MIDSHTHLDSNQYDQDRADVIVRAYESGVEKIINVGADLDGSLQSVQLANENENIFASVGVHPHVFNEVAKKPIVKVIEELRSLAKNKKVIAIGEIGLDYFMHSGEDIMVAQKEAQKEGFIVQIELASQMNLPVIIHCRDAYADTLDIIKKYPKANFVFHCYGGNLEFTKKLLNLNNIYFSFTGNITYAKSGAEILEVIKEIPMEKIMLETDCPYLTPVPNRGKRNEPALVAYVCEKIAEIKDISTKEVDRITTNNTYSFFKIG